MTRPPDPLHLADTWAFLRNGMQEPKPSSADWSAIEEATPNALLDEVSNHGVQNVWHASLAAVGFPFTWATTAAEFTAIRHALRRMSNDGD